MADVSRSRKPQSNLRLGELRRLFRCRRGREELIINADLDPLIEQALPGWQVATADALGDRLELTFREKITLGIRTIRCCDRTAWYVAKFYRRIKRRRDRIRAQRSRARDGLSLSAGRSARAQCVLEALAGRRMTIRTVTDAVAGCSAFKSLDHEACRRAVHRTLKELEGCGDVKVKKTEGVRGDVLLIEPLRV